MVLLRGQLVAHKEVRLMEEETAIDVIYKMYGMLKNIEQRIELMEKNINLLNDKANGKLMEAIGNNRPLPAKAEGPQESSNVQEMPLPPPPPEAPPPEMRVVDADPAVARENIKVTGKFMDRSGKAIPDIEVTIVNEDGDVIKTTRTNRGGYMLAFLPPGQYSAEFIKEGYPPTFRVFELVKGQTEVEIL